jgi:putative acyl-CoA dehydrogenase
VEESGMPRLYRQQPLQSIWEGSSNIICLDVLRALRRSPETLDFFLGECREAAGADRRLDEWLTALEEDLRDPEDLEARARVLVERMGLALQASLLVRFGAAAVADAFCASRLAHDRGLAYGTLPRGVDAAAIVDRHRPRI